MSEHQPGSREALRAMVEKWRKKADHFDTEAQTTERPASHRLAESLEWEASRLRDCAAELEHVLAQMERERGKP